MIGTLLGNRYEILELVGTGGMANVYKAKCTMLNRFVAIKVLKEEFSNDQEFLKRFSIESQASAGLSHSNVVSVYDVGEQENIHYIVMEYTLLLLTICTGMSKEFIHLFKKNFIT